MRNEEKGFSDLAIPRRKAGSINGVGGGSSYIGSEGWTCIGLIAADVADDMWRRVVSCCGMGQELRTFIIERNSGRSMV